MIAIDLDAAKLFLFETVNGRHNINDGSSPYKRKDQPRTIQDQGDSPVNAELKCQCLSKLQRLKKRLLCRTYCEAPACPIHTSEKRTSHPQRFTGETSRGRFERQLLFSVIDENATSASIVNCDSSSDVNDPIIKPQEVIQAVTDDDVEEYDENPVNAPIVGRHSPSDSNDSIIKPQEVIQAVTDDDVEEYDENPANAPIVGRHSPSDVNDPIIKPQEVIQAVTDDDVEEYDENPANAPIVGRHSPSDVNDPIIKPQEVIQAVTDDDVEEYDENPANAPIVGRHSPSDLNDSIIKPQEIIQVIDDDAKKIDENPTSVSSVDRQTFADVDEFILVEQEDFIQTVADNGDFNAYDQLPISDGDAITEDDHNTIDFEELNERATMDTLSVITLDNFPGYNGNTDVTMACTEDIDIETGYTDLLTMKQFSVNIMDSDCVTDTTEFIDSMRIILDDGEEYVELPMMESTVDNVYGTSMLNFFDMIRVGIDDQEEYNKLPVIERSRSTEYPTVGGSGDTKSTDLILSTDDKNREAECTKMLDIKETMNTMNGNVEDLEYDDGTMDMMIMNTSDPSGNLEMVTLRDTTIDNTDSPSVEEELINGINIHSADSENSNNPMDESDMMSLTNNSTKDVKHHTNGKEMSEIMDITKDDVKLLDEPLTKDELESLAKNSSTKQTISTFSAEAGIQLPNDIKTMDDIYSATDGTKIPADKFQEIGIFVNDTTDNSTNLLGERKEVLMKNRVVRNKYTSVTEAEYFLDERKICDTSYTFMNGFSNSELMSAEDWYKCQTNCKVAVNNYTINGNLDKPPTTEDSTTLEGENLAPKTHCETADDTNSLAGASKDEQSIASEYPDNHTYDSKLKTSNISKENSQTTTDLFGNDLESNSLKFLLPLASRIDQVAANCNKMRQEKNKMSVNKATKDFGGNIENCMGLLMATRKNIEPLLSHELKSDNAGLRTKEKNEEEDIERNIQNNQEKKLEKGITQFENHVVSADDDESILQGVNANVTFSTGEGARPKMTHLPAATNRLGQNMYKQTARSSRIPVVSRYAKTAEKPLMYLTGLGKKPVRQDIQSKIAAKPTRYSTSFGASVKEKNKMSPKSRIPVVIRGCETPNKLLPNPMIGETNTVCQEADGVENTDKMAGNTRAGNRYRKRRRKKKKRRS